MTYRPSSTISGFTDRIVSKKGSGTQVVAGLIVLIIGIGATQVIENQLLVYTILAIGLAIIISSFLMIIQQYQMGQEFRLEYHL